MHKRKIAVFCCLLLIVAVGTRCITDHPKNLLDARGEQYAGSEKCMQCHQDIYDSYINTAHYRTSSPASAKTILGSFDKDSNAIFYRPALKVVMEKHGNSFYQVAYIDNVPKEAEKFDIVVGSGRKGQSYLYWSKNKIFQLPVSYNVPSNAWTNSPGYPPENVLFNRHIEVGCFECHASYIDKTGTQPEGQYHVDFFSPNGLIYGIDCERCHGPAKEHVLFHEKHPEAKEAKFIPAVNRSSRQQQLDMCGICHSGARQTVASAFYFKPGDRQQDYLVPDTATLHTGKVDVHGKQYQLLTASQCFLKSNTLTCSSCHDPHVRERDNLQGFSKKCMSCHPAPNHHTFDLAQAGRVNINCIDCHMPTQPSAMIALNAQGNQQPEPALVRTHFISIYAGLAQQLLGKASTNQHLNK